MRYVNGAGQSGHAKFLLKPEAAGVQKAVATSSHRLVAERYLQAANIASRMDAVIAGDQVENGKPAPDVFLEALKRFNCGPGNALVPEDSKNGLLASVAAVIRCVLVPDLVPMDEECYEKSYCVVESLLDARGVVEGMGAGGIP